MSHAPKPRIAPPRTAAAALRVFYRHLSPWILTIASVSAVSWRLTLGDWSVWDGVIALALFAWWPFQEWLIHVYLLHFRPVTIAGIRIDPPNARKHRMHHRDPNRIPLTFIPVHTFVTTLPALVVGSLLLFPTLALAATCVATFTVLSLHYEWCHYLAHIPWTPNVGYYRRICHAHNLHHHRHEQRWFGVSRTFGDRVLGTDPDVASTERSPTVRTLGIPL